jgi:DNA-binding MarR family transcriptional regulator
MALKESMRANTSNVLYVPAPRLNQLNLLLELASNASVTQAELSRRCGLSVAMVNNYMKELCRLGWLEYRRKSSKTVSYHLTASGLTQLASVQCELLQELARFFSEAKERIRDLIGRQSPGRRFVLCGSGSLTELAYHALRASGLEVLAVCDDSSTNVDRGWTGVPAIIPEQIPDLRPDAVIVADDERAEAICRRLKDLPLGTIRLIRLDRVGLTPEHSHPALATAGNVPN